MLLDVSVSSKLLCFDAALPRVPICKQPPIMMYAGSRTSRKPLSPYAPAFAVGSENSPMQTCYTPQKGITGGLAMAERDAGVPNGAARSITSRLQVLETKVLVPHTNVICRYARVMRHLRSVRLIQRAFRATLKRREESNARAFYELLHPAAAVSPGPPEDHRPDHLGSLASALRHQHGGSRWGHLSPFVVLASNAGGPAPHEEPDR